ncbi:MAG: sulfurtransferase [Rhizobiaceae bacterium]
MKIAMRFYNILLFLVLLPCAAISGEHPGPLVEAEWLQANLEKRELVVLDIRSPRKSRDFYAEGHIKGAVSAPYNHGWRKTINGVVGMLPPVPEISEHIGSLGIGNNMHVVIAPFGNSSTDFSAATRIYWTFKVLGHNSISILNGGYAAWLSKGGKLSNEGVVPIPRRFEAVYQTNLVASEKEVFENLNTGAILVDARPAAQYEGKAKSPVVARAGTIPNSVNFRQSLLYNPKATTFLSQERIDTSAQKLGLERQKSTIAFCNTGHWASIAWFALSEVSGRKDVKLYDGSMAEWTATAGNPIQ